MNLRIRNIMPPDIYYFNVCYEGYKNFGFDTRYLEEALKEVRHHE